MVKPLISLIAPAIKKNLYMNFYNSISHNNKVSFEVIFVGYNPPDEKFPDNFKYIYTTVKPSQCVEIAAREAHGDFLIPIADDCIFSDGFLNRVEFHINNIDIAKTLIGFRYKIGGIVADDRLWLKYTKKKNQVQVVPSCCYDKKVWYEIGGVDRRFNLAHYEIDIQLRFQERGMNLFITPDCIIEELSLNDQGGHGVSSLYERTKRNGKKTFFKLWMNKDKSISPKRLRGVKRFSDDRILYEDQNG